MGSARGGGAGHTGRCGRAVPPPTTLLCGLRPESRNFWFTCGFFFNSLQGLVVCGVHHQMGVPTVCVQGGASQGETLFPSLTTVLTPHVGFPAPASPPVSRTPAGVPQLSSLLTPSPQCQCRPLSQKTAPPSPQRPALGGSPVPHTSVQFGYEWASHHSLLGSGSVLEQLTELRGRLTVLRVS